MIESESNSFPDVTEFDVSIVPLGFEQRCRHVIETTSLTAQVKLAMEFGFLKEASYDDNRKFFEASGYQIIPGLSRDTIDQIVSRVLELPFGKTLRCLVDISAMSREMIANVALALERIRQNQRAVDISVAYAPSEFSGNFSSGTIKRSGPIKPELAGWSSHPEMPMAAIVGLGCEPGLALGALQNLEPSKAWLFRPRGIDENFSQALDRANCHIEDIFNSTTFEYEIMDPARARGRLEQLISSCSNSYRLVIVPFGPKIFSWLAVSSVVFNNLKVGVWAFSSKEKAVVVDRKADGPISWYRSRIIPDVR